MSYRGKVWALLVTVNLLLWLGVALLCVQGEGQKVCLVSRTGPPV